MIHRFFGIDLGTTNCALAKSEAGKASEAMSIRQAVSLRELEEQTLLPSFLYIPNDEERKLLEGRAQLAGVFARKQSERLLGRVVQSAKSWLSLSSDTATAKILPWQSSEVEDEQKVSAVEASAEFLTCIKESIEELGPISSEDKLHFTVTVPASFNESAQALTREALVKAGLPEDSPLLEEPQAAFYAWLEEHGGSAQLLTLLPSLEKTAQNILVVDIGGGTSDFSLFTIEPVSRHEGLPKIKRIAVSEHLLIGGDNVDLAIAHRLAENFGGLSKLDSESYSQLLFESRRIKELAFSETSPEEFQVAIAGRGASIFASSLSAEIAAEEVRSIVLEGFYPDCEESSVPTRSSETLEEFGLPYPSDSAITKHLAEFVSGNAVNAVLFNGGSLKSAELRQRIVENLSRWKSSEVRELESQTLDLSVAKGAAFYSRLHFQRETFIDSSLPHSLYLSVAAGAEQQLLCLLPKGSKPGDRMVLSELNLKLKLNRLAQFDLYRSKFEHEAGSLSSFDKDSFKRVAPLKAFLQGKAAKQRSVAVNLEAELLETGMLSLRIINEDDKSQSWKLDFVFRSAATTPESQVKPDSSATDPAKLAKAYEEIERAFGKKADKDYGAKNLPRDLEAALGIQKEHWDLNLLRKLWIALEPGITRRSRSLEHERIWLYLAGFSLRPGFGVEGDKVRVQGLWRAFELGLQNKDDKNCLEQWWIMWRRVAPGLSQESQKRLFKTAQKYLGQKGESSIELLRLAASLEKLDLAEKKTLAKLFLKRAHTKGATGRDQALIALGRLGSRQMLAAGSEFTLASSEVWNWFQKLSAEDWTEAPYTSCSQLFSVAAARHSQEALELSEEQRSAILQKMTRAGASDNQLEKLREVQPLSTAGQQILLGESAPLGLELSYTNSQ